MRYQLHKFLREAECRFLLNTQVTRIEDDAVFTVSEDKKETLSPVDQVVLAVGMTSRQALKKTLEEKKADLHVHITYSDSTLSPEEVVKCARDKGLDCIAIADRDTILISI